MDLIEKNKNDEKEYLCFIKLIGENINGNEYEFYFTKNLNDFWGEDFAVKPSFLINNIVPFDDTYDLIERITMNNNIKLDLASKDSSHSFQDCIDGVIALGAQNIDEGEYPEIGRLILYFGEDYDSVEKKLSQRNSFFQQN